MSPFTHDYLAALARALGVEVLGKHLFKSALSIWALPAEGGRRNRAKKKIDLRLNSFLSRWLQTMTISWTWRHPSTHPPTVLRVPQCAQYLYTTRVPQCQEGSGNTSGLALEVALITFFSQSWRRLRRMSGMYLLPSILFLHTRRTISWARRHPDPHATWSCHFNLFVTLQAASVIWISPFGLSMFTLNSLRSWACPLCPRMSRPKYPKDEDVVGGYVCLVNLSKTLHIHYPTPNHK